MNPSFTKPVLNLIRQLEQEEFLIDEDRQAELLKIAADIKHELDYNNIANVLIICTHNSRRSQLGELWIRVAASYFNIPNLYTYSGGTSINTFNTRMIHALNRAGFMMDLVESGTNPKYNLSWSRKNKQNQLMFSKIFGDPPNPKNNFIAILVCSDADEVCPIVPGASSRYYIPYEDPKAYDGSLDEELQYDVKVQEIGREAIFLIKHL